VVYDSSTDKTRAILDLADGEQPALGDDDDKKGQYSFARYTVQGDHYAGFYQTWVKAILFLLGRHWLKWMNGARRYTTDTSVPPWKQQPVTNIVYAIYRSLATKLTKQKPALEVVPPSGDSEDRESAALGGSILEHLWRLLKFPTKLRRGIGWFLCTGQVYLRVHWDPDAGKLVPLTELREVPHSDPELAATGETMDVEAPLDDQGEPIEKDGPDGTKVPDLEAEPAQVPEGEIDLGIVDPLCVRYNPEAEDPEDADEMFVATLWPKKDACSHFKIKETDLVSGDDGDKQMYADLISSAAAGPGWLSTNGAFGSQIGASQDTAIGDQVLVIEFYSRREPRKYPGGRHWISIGMKKVWPPKDDEDYPNGEAKLPNGFWPPLIPVLSTPIPGQPQAMGVLPQVVPLNEQYNTVDAKILEHEVTMAMGGKWVVHPEDKGLVITSDPAQVLASKGYALGKPPVQVKLEALPADVYAERNVIMEKVRLVASLSEIELGKKPAGVSAGRAFLVLQEVTDSVVGPDLEAWEHALEEVGRRCLVLAKTHYREERKIQIRGERGEWEVRAFDMSDLADGLDVRVQVGSSFPWSKSAQLDTKLDVLSKFPGLVQKPDGTVDRQKFAHFMDVGSVGLSSFESDADPDLVEIEREHAMFDAFDPAKGEQQLPQLAFWQAHAIHLEEHFRFMKRDRARFDRWSEPAKAAFMKHMQDTMKAVDELASIAVGAAGPAEEPAAEVEAEPGTPQLQVSRGGGGRGPSRPNERPVLNAGDRAAAVGE
jgi:hypothetical protein